MSKPELQALMRTIIVDAATEQHPSIEELLCYHRRELATEERDRLADHLSVCPSCTRAVADMAAFPQRESESHLDAAEVGRRWERLQSRLVEVSGPAARVPKATPQWFSSPSFSLRLAQGLAAALLLALVGTLWLWNADTGPRLNLVIAEFMPEGEDGLREAGATLVVRLPVAADGVLIVLALTDQRSFSAYEVEVFAASGESVWKSESLERSADGIFTFQLPRGFLDSGRYRIRLHGVGAAERVLLAVYRFDLEYE